MGKAFVAKLAKEGARDPEALAAWIGRKKHGKAFGKLAAKGRSDGGGKSSDGKSKSNGSSREMAAAARQKQAFPKQASAQAQQETASQQAGTVGVARHYSGKKVYGSPALIERAAQRKDYDTGTTTASGGDHDALLQRASPAFRRKVKEARESGRPWIHQVGHDSSGAEIHQLEHKDAAGKTQTVTYLERNSAAWKRMSAEERRRRHDARNS